MKNIYLIVSILLACLFITACNDTLLPEPTSFIPSSEDVNVSVETYPVNVTASQGLKRKITISWAPVNRAVRYDIFSAASPYSEFIQTGETNGTTTFDYICDAGTSRYFKIQAVNAKNISGPFSDTVFGTSLSEPYITLIENNNDTNDTSVSVYWWMNDASFLPYTENLIYTVTCKDDSGNIVDQKSLKHTDLTETKTVFSGLKATSQYYFTVDAFLLTAQDDIESSYSVDILTARKLFPNPPENLYASQGTEVSSVELFFTLPELVDVAAGKGIYEQKPLYFNIYRKLYESDDNWELIASNVKPLEYIPQETFSYTDDNVRRGNRYDYKVQSFADTNKIISSDYSSAYTSGWPMSVPRFSILDTNPVLNSEGTFFESDSVTFSFSWETFGKSDDYNFILEEKRKDLEADIELNGENTYESVQENFTTIDELNSYIRYFTLPDDRGYYTYNVKIVLSSDNATEVAALSGSRRILITQDTSKPEIRNFTSEDGFSDKFILTFEYDNTCSYELKYVNAYKEGNEWVYEDYESQAITVDLTQELENAESGDIITITQSAQAGDARKYMLSAIRGFSVEEETEILKTLGKAELIKTQITNDSFTVKWEPVQKAESYKVSYSYIYDDVTLSDELKTIRDENNENDIDLSLPNLGEKQIDIADLTNESVNGFKLLSDGSVSYTVTEVLGSHDARIAGLPVSLTVTAINNSSETSASLKDIQLLGPAASSPTATQAQYPNKIVLNWKKVDGASLYCIVRQRYDISDTNILSTDTYLVMPERGSVNLSGEELSQDYVSLTDGAFITLTDFYAEKPEGTSSSYEDNQDKIQWGFPYHYTVIPVTDEDYIFSASAYVNLDKVCTRGSALGYGHNVTASKSESASKVFVTYTKPFIPAYLNLTPVLWYTEYNQNNWQRSDITPDSQGRFVITPDKNDRTKAFLYAVKYYADNVKPAKNYLDQLAASAEADEYGEPLNKGYIFAINSRIECVKENDRPSYSEKITWDSWDYETRARGPGENSSFTIQIKNYNLSDSWYSLAAQDAQGNISSLADTSYKINVIAGSNSVTITPSDLVSDSDIHTGILEVLRDYRHFGKVLFVRDTEDGEIEGSYTFDPSAFWTDRKITNAEYAKAAMLTFTYPFYLSCGGNTDYSNMTDCYVKPEKTVTDGEGSFYISEGALVTDISEIFLYPGKYNHTFKFTSYAPLQKTPSEKSVRFLRLSCPDGKLMRKGLNEGFYKFKERINLSVSLSNDAENSEYSGTLSVDCDENWNLTVTVSRTGYPSYSKSCTTKDEVHNLFPMRFASDSSWFFTSNGWWH